MRSKISSSSTSKYYLYSIRVYFAWKQNKKSDDFYFVLGTYSSSCPPNSEANISLQFINNVFKTIFPKNSPQLFIYIKARYFLDRSLITGSKFYKFYP